MTDHLANEGTASLTTYGKFDFGKMAVATIDAALMMKVVEPLWVVSPRRRPSCRLIRGGESASFWRKLRRWRSGIARRRWRAVAGADLHRPPRIADDAA
jgi:hypothetical protein